MRITRYEQSEQYFKAHPDRAFHLRPAPEEDAALFGPVIDYFARQRCCPVLVVRRADMMPRLCFVQGDLEDANHDFLLQSLWLNAEQPCCLAGVH